MLGTSFSSLEHTKSKKEKKFLFYFKNIEVFFKNYELLARKLLTSSGK